MLGGEKIISEAIKLFYVKLNSEKSLKHFFD